MSREQSIASISAPVIALQQSLWTAQSLVRNITRQHSAELVRPK
jgi:hypothetical protein